MDRFRTMQSFAEVIRLGSLSEAAKTLGLSRALISRHVTDLEKHLGVRLLTRTTRRITLTEAGAKHFKFCQQVIKEIEEKEASLKRLQKEPEGTLKILAPKSFTTLALGDAIASFAAAYPHLNISLMLDDLSFRSYDFIERGFDVAVHTTPIRDCNLVTRKIASLRWVLCASPKYLKHHDQPRIPRDLSRHKCLVHINSDPSDRVWRLHSGNGVMSVKVQGPFASNSVLMLRKAALQALGIAILPLYCVKEDLKSGALREVLADFPIPVHPLSLVFSPGKPTPQKVRFLGDFLVDWFRKRPIPQ
ncbi:MAG: LysR family transcriptional regulator [Deltaproteobacteria bacterium]